MSRAWLLAALLAAGCVGPVGPFAGGPLVGGVLVTAPVESWPFADERILELETDPQDPRSVNMHFVAEGPHLWVATILGESSTWAQSVLADDRVRLRVGDSIYERRAVRVTDRAEIVHVAELYRDKYVISPDVEEYESALVFRLE